MSQSEIDECRDDMPGALSRRSLFGISLAAILLGAPGARAQQAGPKPFSPEELDQILAPIALYDDALLSQVLMAASYPLEIVEASRWLQANPSLKGEAAVAAVADKTWDVSVKSLVAFPSVLAQLNDHLDWTQKLGDALIGQQQDVAASIQRLRAKASAAGTLKSGPQQTVTAQTQGNETVYVIQQANPEVVYVPTYDPNTAYGQWSNPAYPPTYFPLGGALLRGLTWGVGIAAAGALFGGWNWGYGGGGSYVNVNANRAINIDRNFNRASIGDGSRWQHDATHRRGVAYRDPAIRQQFGQVRPGADQRQQFRGQLDRPAGPGAGGPGNAGRPGAGGGGPGLARPGAGGGGAQRPAAGPGSRPGGGGGPLAGTNRGPQVNRDAQRGHAQQQRAAASRGGGGARPGGGGGGGARAGGGGGGGARGGGGGGGARGGGGGGRR